jgi:hypothetical protein
VTRWFTEYGTKGMHKSSMSSAHMTSYFPIVLHGELHGREPNLIFRVF